MHVPIARMLQCIIKYYHQSTKVLICQIENVGWSELQQKSLFCTKVKIVKCQDNYSFGPQNLTF